jgi:hypothetical protein
MANDIFYVSIKTSKAVNAYAFTRSETGILDYAGDATPSADELSRMQCVEGSAYFTPSWYTYLPEALLAEISVYIPVDIENLDANQYSFLLHVGALLLAVEMRDSLLVAELLHRRSMVFANFTPILLHILKPVAPESLFAWIYGGFHGDGNFLQIYANDAPVSTGETDTATILYAAAREALKPEPSKETAEGMFIRYFKGDGNRKFNFTMGIVGAANHPWVDSIEKFEKISGAATGFHFADDPEKAGKKRSEIFESLKVKVQAEPYNPHDHNAVSVFIDDLESVLKGARSKCKAGYLRSTGAAILRHARPNLYSYESSLWRIGGNPDYFENAIIVRLKF